MSGTELRIQAFVKLGSFLREFVSLTSKDKDLSSAADERLQQADEKLREAEIQNGWFTRQNLMDALSEWGGLLAEDSLREWLDPYDINSNKPKTVAIISAGNIPLVGFHDFLGTLITGNKALVKCATNDKILLPFLARLLTELEPSFKHSIEFSEGILENYDAVIATGSNNTSRYFEYYFGKKPHIIRKNRNSIAILKGDETKEILELLAEDIFRYFGLGCRSVSKVFVPKDYNFDLLFNALYKYRDLLNHQKYSNNYDYNKAVYLMSEFKILDNGFFILKEDSRYASPIASLFYEYYESAEELKSRLEKEKEQIQCVVAQGILNNEVDFGQTQRPKLDDFADGVDTVEFLLRT